MGIVLEQAQEADAQTVADFMDFVAGESDNLAFGVGEFVRQHSESEAVFLRQQLESGGFTLLAWNQVKGGPQLVGLLSANCETRSRSAHCVRLAIVVKRVFQGEGIDRRLIEWALSKLESDQAVEIVFLEVERGNEYAVKLCERWGFEETDVVRELLEAECEPADAHLMGRLFVRNAAPEGAPLVYMRDVLDALESSSDDWSALLNRETGEVDYSYDGWDDGLSDDWADDAPDFGDPKWICLPSQRDLDDWHCMRSFASWQGDRACDELLGALHSRHGYRRFKDCAADLGLLSAYFKYQDDWRRDIMASWMETQGLTWTDGRKPR